MFDYLAYKINKKRIQKNYRKKKGPCFFVSDPEVFFSKLDSHSISYVHLPEVESLCEDKGQSKILLVNSTEIRKVLSFGSKLKKGTRVYLYSSHGGNKTTFGDFTLFPSSFSLEVLAQRERENYCFVPSVDNRILSFLYYLAYHTVESSEGDLYLEMDATTVLEQHNTFLSVASCLRFVEAIKGKNVFEVLCHYCWDIPYDLYVKMEARGKFPRSIAKFIDLPEICKINAKKYPAMFTYMIREDVARFGYLDFVLERLNEKFNILYSEKLSASEAYNTYSFTRGGVWTKRSKDSGRLEDKPLWLVVGNDLHLTAPEAGTRLKKHSILDNKNLLFKEELRTQINDRSSYTVSGVHGNDNAVEAQYILYRIFADKYAEMVDSFAAKIEQ